MGTRGKNEIQGGQGTSLRHQETDEEPGRQQEGFVCLEMSDGELWGKRRACWEFGLDLRQARAMEVERMEPVV